MSIKKKIKLLATLSVWLLCIVPGLTHATIYEYRNADGNPVFSDTPPPNVNSKAVKLGPVSGFTAPTTPEPEKEVTTPTHADNMLEKPSQPEHVSYTKLELISPAKQSHYHNTSSIPVEVYLEPELQPGDTIEVLVDGKLRGAPHTSDSFYITEYNRGKHQLQVQIKSKEGKILSRSLPSIFYLHRKSIIKAQ